MDTTRHLDAGGLVLTKAKVDAGAVEQIVGRTYKHPALGDRAVVRLASDRLGQAEDLAMEFLGFQAPTVTAPVGQQQRRSLGFAAWALVNDPKHARYALDLVKQMKKAARQARSKPGHAWDAYSAMAKDLGKSAPHFLPPFWEEVGRSFKDLGNQTYAGRALNKSVEAERVHALESDKARRRDVVLEFVLAGCMSGTALSEYGDDLAKQYPPAEAFAVFRDLSVRRTRGGMAPWATLTKDFTKLAKAAKLNADEEIERWLEEVIDAPAMRRAPQQFWKACSAHCKRIVARNPGFAVALLRHTPPEAAAHTGGKLDEWLEMLEGWGVFEFLWEDEIRGAPPLGEPIATWFGRIVRDALPAPARTLEMLQKLAPRLKKENIPLPLSVVNKWGYSNGIDVDVLETCLSLNIKVDDPPRSKSIVYDDAALDGPPRYFVHIDFTGWLLATPDHPLRNQDLVACSKDPRFEMSIRSGLYQALQCKGGPLSRGYRKDPLEQRPFPRAAAERPGVTALWREHTKRVIASLENTGLASFQSALHQLRATLWPDTLRLFPDLAQRLLAVDPVDMLQRTLQAGLLDEYGLPALERIVDEENLTLDANDYQNPNLFLLFPNIVVHNKVHASVIAADGKVTRHELRLPAKCRVEGLLPIGQDLLVGYRDANWQSKIFWATDPGQLHDSRGFYGADAGTLTPLADGAYFIGEGSLRPGDKQLPKSRTYFHDGQRFWQASAQYDQAAQRSRWKAVEVDPHTGKELRASVPAWFEDSDEGTVELGSSELISAPPGTEDSPLGQKDGLLGWKAIERRDGTFAGVGIDGRRWDKRNRQSEAGIPQGLLRQPGGDGYLLITSGARNGDMLTLWDPSGSTMVSTVQTYQPGFAPGQAVVLPLRYWHLLKVRDEASSRKLRAISRAECEILFAAAEQDRARNHGVSKPDDKVEARLQGLFAAVKNLLPTAPPRMVSGLAQMVALAYAERTGLVELREKPGAKDGSDTATALGHAASDQAAMLWNLTNNDVYGGGGEEGDATEISTSANLLASVAFFKGERDAGVLPWSRQVWYPMLGDLPLRAWQSYWRQTNAKLMHGRGEVPGPWLAFLKFWQQVGLLELTGTFSLIEAAPAKELQYEEMGKSFALTQGSDRFVGMNTRGRNWVSRTYFLRHSTSASPSVPKGYEVIDTRELKVRYDTQQIGAFIDAVEGASALPLPTREELAATAQTLSISPAEVALIWLAGLRMDSYESNYLPPELRNALGLKTTEASAARLALRNLSDDVREQLYAAVVSESMAAPFAADRGPALRALEQAWQAKVPRRVSIDTDLQKRLAALSTSRWDRSGQGELLAAAADPTRHPLLQLREYEIQNTKQDSSWQQFELMARGKDERAPAVQAFTTLAQLIALVHAETPAGHAARAEMPALIKQLTALLSDPGFLLVLRTVHIYADPQKQKLTATQWLNQHVGTAKTSPKDAVTRLDDGLIAAAGDDARSQILIAFRPARLKSESDRQRLRSLRVVGTADPGANADLEARSSHHVFSGSLQIVDLIRNAGFQKLAKVILARDLKPGQWPTNPLLTAPEVVKAIQKKHKLSEEAAAYYAQLLALPEPTNANVSQWNGWKPAQLKAAAAELAQQKLVLEATRARAGRSVFLPGEWSELKAPWLPLETWKLAHLVEKDEHLQSDCPLGGPLVLRPFGELFAAAWQRVLDGNVPGYEEVQRGKKKK